MCSACNGYCVGIFTLNLRRSLKNSRRFHTSWPGLDGLFSKPKKPGNAGFFYLERDLGSEGFAFELLSNGLPVNGFQNASTYFGRTLR